MSMPRNITVNCSKCGKSLTATMFVSVNSDYSNDLAMQIMSGELFDVKCPRCQFVSHLEYDFLYHDMHNRAMIWVVHKNSPDYESKLSEIRSTQKLPYKTLRIVEDMNALKEKVSCLESKRDDRIIELCKVFTVYDLLSKHPDFDFADAFYTAASGKEMIYLFGNDGKEMCCELPDKLYHVLQEAYENSPYAAQFNGDYAIVDYAWAEAILLPLMKAKTEGVDATTEKKASEPKTVVAPKTKVICPKCNSGLPEDSEFCHMCGTKLSAATTSEPSQTEQEKQSQADIERKRIEQIQYERDLAIQKRIAVTEAANRRKKIIKRIVICIVAAIIAAGIIKIVIDSVHNSELRNFATEKMNDDYTKVYADVVSIEPEYFVYTSYNNGRYDISEIVCRCVTVEGKRIWATVDIWEYPGGSSIEEHNEPQFYSKSNPKRIVGSVTTAKKVMDELAGEIGNVFVLDVSERINK